MIWAVDDWFLGARQVRKVRRHAAEARVVALWRDTKEMRVRCKKVKLDDTFGMVRHAARRMAAAAT